MKNTILCFTLLFLSSCSLNQFGSSSKKLISGNKRYKQTEVSGSYLVDVKTGFDKEKNYIKKVQISSAQNKSKVFEKTIVVSKKRQLVKNVDFVFPIKYESTYYLDGQSYKVSGNVDYKLKRVSIKLKSPEAQWNGVKTYKFQSGVKALCSYVNIVECVKVTGFFTEAIDKKNGDMNLHILWESFPYFQEQYLNMPKEIMSAAVISYENTDKKGNYRFSLNVGGQIQVITIDKNYNVVGHFWSSQGLTRERL